MTPTPRPFQVDGIAWLRARRRGCLFDDMGLGKTMQLLLALPLEARAIVACPAVVKRNWAAELRTWRSDLRPTIIEGRNAVYRWPHPGEVLLVNYEILPQPRPRPAPRGGPRREGGVRLGGGGLLGGRAAAGAVPVSGGSPEAPAGPATGRNEAKFRAPGTCDTCRGPMPAKRRGKRCSPACVRKHHRERMAARRAPGRVARLLARAARLREEAGRLEAQAALVENSGNPDDM